MRAVAKTGPGVGVEVIDTPEPETQPGSVKIKVHACGICGTDLKIYKGEYRPSGRDLTYPSFLGHEPSGVVTEVGEGVTRFKEGDRIFAEPRGPCGQCHYCHLGRFEFCEGLPRIGNFSSGAFAQYTVLPEVRVHPVPPDLGLDEASLMEPMGVGVRAIGVSRLKAGDTALVVGPGPIGLLTALTARAAGAGPLLISGLGIDSPRLALARELGFQTVDIDDESLGDAVMEATNGHGVDVVYETAGVFEDTLPFIKLDVRRMYNLLSSGQVDLSRLITHRVPLEEVSRAFKMLEAREGVKIVLVP
jgi:L-iditol 2-dehydrogenase